MVACFRPFFGEDNILRGVSFQLRSFGTELGKREGQRLALGTGRCNSAELLKRRGQGMVEVCQEQSTWQPGHLGSTLSSGGSMIHLAGRVEEGMGTQESWALFPVQRNNLHQLTEPLRPQLSLSCLADGYLPCRRGRPSSVLPLAYAGTLVWRKLMKWDPAQEQRKPSGAAHCSQLLSQLG